MLFLLIVLSLLKEGLSVAKTCLRPGDCTFKIKITSVGNNIVTIATTVVTIFSPFLHT